MQSDLASGFLLKEKQFFIMSGKKVIFSSHLSEVKLTLLHNFSTQIINSTVNN